MFLWLSEIHMNVGAAFDEDHSVATVVTNPRVADLLLKHCGGRCSVMANGGYMNDSFLCLLSIGLGPIKTVCASYSLIFCPTSCEG